ncbi:MAG: FAD-binding oxidoreductase, partial [Chloroflexi bacterium]|nr:FAD-binding oxidoreductase [Chloroflexota bacterium]
MDKTASVVICGAGIAGVSTAYHLAVTYGLTDVVIVDPMAPLSVTSDKSMEGYRNWWPGPDDAMVSLTNHSIDMLEAMHRQQPDLLRMDRGGYMYATAVPANIPHMIATAEESTSLGAGDLRIHRSAANDSYVPVTEHGVFDAPTGADILLDKTLIQRHFPYLNKDCIAVLHARRCGWFAARQYAMHMLEEAREKGVRLLEGTVEAVTTQGGRVNGVKVCGKEGVITIDTPAFVNAAGPYQKQVAALLGVDLPVRAELHVKASFNDARQTMPRHMPMLIWEDPIRLPWTEEERPFLAESPETAWLLDEQKGGIIGRPEGEGDSLSFLMQWHYYDQPDEPTIPFPLDPFYPEYMLRGLSTVLPALEPYLDNMPRPFMDGGYYVRTQENRPIAGPMMVDGAFVLGGLGGSGMHT